MVLEEIFFINPSAGYPAKELARYPANSESSKKIEGGSVRSKTESPPWLSFKAEAFVNDLIILSHAVAYIY